MPKPTYCILCIRYSAGLNGFTAEGDHLPVAVEDTAEVAEARADFMAYMIELMAKQDHEEQMNMAVHEKSDVGAIDYADLNEVRNRDQIKCPTVKWLNGSEIKYFLVRRRLPSTRA